MRIQSVRSFLLSYTLPEPLRLSYYGGERTVVKRDAMLVRVETDRLMREDVGPDIDLMVDAHTWWRMGDRNYVASTVDRIAEQLAKYHVAWLEEPLPPDDHEAYLRLKQLDYVPLASGEHEPD